MNSIPYGHQDISEEDIAAVVRALRSEWITQGPAVPSFEQAMALRCNVAHAVAVSSGTAALHLACMAAGLGPGDRLWTSPITFVASANCALYCRAEVGFVDIDPRTFNMSVTELERRLGDADRRGVLPKVIVPVHFAGQSCEMRGIADLAHRYGIMVIEDASHALGASYCGRPVGACEYSDAAVLSFHPVKMITTGEGGMVLTNAAGLAKKVARLRTHGITRDTGRMERTPPGAWYYEQIELGFNYRMTDIQAALGENQLIRLDTFVQRRNEVAKRYREALNGLPLRMQWEHPDCHSSYHLFVVSVDRQRASVSRRRVFDHLSERGIGANVHYIPVHTQPYYRRLGFKCGDFPSAEEYYEGAVTLPMFSSLTDEQQDAVVFALREILE